MARANRLPVLFLAAASCFLSQSALALEPVLTPAAEPTVAAAMSHIPPPCGAALGAIRIEGSRIKLAYEHPSFEITIVHPAATNEGQRVGPYQVLAEDSPACPHAASQIVEGLRGQSLADPWTLPTQGPDGGDASPAWRDVLLLPRTARTWIGFAIILLHLAVLGALVDPAMRRGSGGGSWSWRIGPLAIAALASVARFATPPVVFNWYSFTEAAPTGFLAFAQGFVGLEQALACLWPSGVPMTEIVAFVRVSGGLSAGLGLMVAEKAGVPRRVALVTGVLLALWPALVRMGASDAQHPVALTLWLVFCLAWARARERGGGFAAILLLVGVFVPLVRAETMSWIPAAIVLFPPRRRTPLASWIVLAVVGAAAAAVALLPLRQIESSPGPIVAWIFSPLSASAGMSVAPSVLGAFGALGLTILLVSGRGLAARLLACALVVALPVLVSGKLADNPLTMRYFLPLGYVLLVFCAVSLVAMGDLLTPERRLAPVLGAVLLSASEARAWLASDAQYTFRHEVPFLRAAMARLPPNTTVCLLDPAMNHDWPGSHKDIDTAWSPRGGGRYYGMERRLVVVAEPREGSLCDYYYEGATCALDPMLGEDGVRFRQVCDAWHERVENPPIATEERQPVSFGAWLGPGPVHLSLYRLRAPEP